MRLQLITILLRSPLLTLLLPGAAAAFAERSKLLPSTQLCGGTVSGNGLRIPHRHEDKDERHNLAPSLKLAG